jgi:hypothetical protein
MEQQKHDDNFCQKNVLHYQFLNYLSLLLKARERFTCRSAMLSPHWLVKEGVSYDLSNLNPQPVRDPLQNGADFDAWPHPACAC